MNHHDPSKIGIISVFICMYVDISYIVGFMIDVNLALKAILMYPGA